MAFRKRLQETIRRMGLLKQGDTVLVGVSGGPDSMALLHALWRLSAEEDWRVFAVHVNHQLRGEASEADQAYVEARCREWGIPCEVHRVDVSARLREQGGTCRMWPAASAMPPSGRRRRRCAPTSWRWRTRRTTRWRRF